jgi:hypothetical protein
MKLRTTILLSSLLTGASAFGDGSIVFNNAPPVGVRVSDYDGSFIGASGLGAGTNFFAQVFWAPGTVDDASLLSPANYPVNFRSLFNAGYVQTSGTTTLGMAVSSTIKLAPLAYGSPATVQVRAWWGGGALITSWEEAVGSSNPLSRFGASPLIHLASTGDPTAEPPEVPTFLDSWQPFSLTLVPEPSSTAFGLLAASLFLRFRTGRRS